VLANVGFCGVESSEAKNYDRSVICISAKKINPLNRRFLIIWGVNAERKLLLTVSESSKEVRDWKIEIPSCLIKNFSSNQIELKRSEDTNHFYYYKKVS
jgi:hypothetical protein